jgi:hypothetical protein
VGAFIFAWLTGEGIISYRTIRDQSGPPWPGQMMMSTGLYVILAMIAQAGPNARRLALTLAWGLNIAAFMDLFSPQTGKILLGNSRLPSQAKKGWWAQVASIKTNSIPVNLILPGSCAGAKSPVQVNPTAPNFGFPAPKVNPNAASPAFSAPPGKAPSAGLPPGTTQRAGT